MTVHASSSADAARVWLITGCSTGLGRALAERVLERGQRAVITARDPSVLAQLGARFPATARTLALDVTDEAQRHAAVAGTVETFGRVDVLVNNAGHGYSAAVEEGEDAPIREMFETNFFGLAALTRTVLPLMRAQGRGHVVNISSIGGIVGNPASGYYSATKFAVEGLTEALAKEVEPLGIRVTLIEPGPFRTDFQGRSMTAAARTIDAYASTAGARRAQLRASSGRQAGDPVRAADAIVEVVESTDPPLHLVLGRAGLERVREKLASLAQSLDTWERVSVATDFPDPAS